MGKSFVELHAEFVQELRKFHPASLLDAALSTLGATYKDPLEALQAAPWHTLLIAKWVAQDEREDESSGGPISLEGFRDLRQRLWEFPEHMDPPKEISFPLFMRRLTYPQIAFQRQMSGGFIREAALLGSLPNNHQLRQQFVTRAGLTPEEFVDLSVGVFAAVVSENMLYLPFTWFRTLQGAYGPALTAYYSLVSCNFAELREFCRGLPDAKAKVASEYFESTPLRRYPFARDKNGLRCWHPMVFFRGMEEMVHSVLSEGGTDYIQPFSQLFETHIVAEAQSTKHPIITEDELREYLGKNSKVPDALISFPSANVFIESKAGLFDDSVMTTGSRTILQHKTKALASAIQQGWTAARGLRAGERAPAQVRNAPVDYLLIVTNRELHTSRGTLLKEMYPGGKLEYPDEQTARWLPLEHIYALSVEEYERLMAAVRDGADLPQLLAACVEADSKPQTAKFLFEQHLAALKVPTGRSDLVNSALDRSVDRLAAAMQGG